MTTLILVRQGHVAWIAPERFRGRAELPLTEHGLRQAQAQAVARHLRDVHPMLDGVHTSPMGRCLETAAPIASAFGLTPEVLPDLNDIDYGAWQGLTREEAHASWPTEVEIWFRTPQLAAIPGGETLPALIARVAGALRHVLARHGPNATVALVSHTSANRAMLCHVLGLSPNAYWRLGQEPCCLNEMHFDGRDFLVRSVNATQHLARI